MGEEVAVEDGLGALHAELLDLTEGYTVTDVEDGVLAVVDVAGFAEAGFEFAEYSRV